LTGFEAIAHHNGWMMALFGAAIVFSGLAVLSFVISQMPRLFQLLEPKSADAPPPIEPEAAKEPARDAAPPPSTDDANAIALQIEPLVSTLNEPFQLSDLYRLCREQDLPHPHLSLSYLRRQGILQPQGEGAFTWNLKGATEQEG